MKNKGLNLPIVRQSNEYTCGAASLLCALHYLTDYSGTESQLSRKLKIKPRTGTQAAKIIQIARQHGLEADLSLETTIKQLKESLESRVVILNFQAWRYTKDRHTSWAKLYKYGHYAVMQKIDSRNIYLMDPWLFTYGRLSLTEFMERWHSHWQNPKTQKNVKVNHLAIFLHQCQKQIQPVNKYEPIE